MFQSHSKSTLSSIKLSSWAAVLLNSVQDTQINVNLIPCVFLDLFEQREIRFEIK